MLDALAGLHAAHELVDLRGQRLEVVHRDVSPQNVIVGTDGVARLIDFGIAKAATTAAGTSSGVLRGKLSYMSPEQINRRPLDRRSDLFAAGVVLHELLTGRRLFSGDDQGDVALSILLGEVVRVSDIAPDVPRALDDVVARALERDVDRRWATAAEFQEALESALAPASARDVARWVIERGGDRIERRREQLRAALDASARAAPVVEAQTQSQQRRAPPWVIGAVAAGALLVAAGAAAKVARSARSTAGGAGEDGAAAAPATAVTGEAASANAGAGDTAGGDAGAPGEGVGAGVHRRHRGPRAAPSEPGLHRNPYGAP
jgi:serine/threonine-protein kinase